MYWCTACSAYASDYPGDSTSLFIIQQYFSNFLTSLHLLQDHSIKKAVKELTYKLKGKIHERRYHHWKADLLDKYDDYSLLSTFSCCGLTNNGCGSVLVVLWGAEGFGLVLRPASVVVLFCTPFGALLFARFGRAFLDGALIGVL